MQRVVTCFLLICGVITVAVPANIYTASRYDARKLDVEQRGSLNRIPRQVPVEQQILDLNRRIEQLESMTDHNDSIVHTEFHNPRSPLTGMVEVFDSHNRPHGQNARTLAMRAIIRPEHIQPVRDDMPAGTASRMNYLDQLRFDEAGHLLASALGGPNDLSNIVPQSPIVNRNIPAANIQETGWYRAELQIANFLRQNANSRVMWSLMVHYGSTSRRPIRFELAFILYDSQGVNRGGNYFNIENYTPDRLPLGFNPGGSRTTSTTTPRPSPVNFNNPLCYAPIIMFVCHLMYF